MNRAKTSKLWQWIDLNWSKKKGKWRRERSINASDHHVEWTHKGNQRDCWYRVKKTTTNSTIQYRNTQTHNSCLNIMVLNQNPKQRNYFDQSQNTRVTPCICGALPTTTQRCSSDWMKAKQHTHYSRGSEMEWYRALTKHIHIRQMFTWKCLFDDRIEAMCSAVKPNCVCVFERECVYFHLYWML